MLSEKIKINFSRLDNLFINFGKLGEHSKINRQGAGLVTRFEAVHHWHLQVHRGPASNGFALEAESPILLIFKLLILDPDIIPANFAIDGGPQIFTYKSGSDAGHQT